jgi:hypothetical protein
VLILLVLGTGFLSLERLGPARPYVPEPYASPGGWLASAGGEDSGHVRAGYVLVHLAEPVHAEHLARLRDDGFAPVGYVAYQNVICRARPGADTRLGVVTSILPEHKLAPELTGLLAPGRDAAVCELVLTLWPGEQSDSVARTIVELDGQVEDVSARSVRFRLDPGKLEAVARLDAVAWIQSVGRFEPFNCDVQWVTQVGWRAETPGEAAGRRVWHKGIRGQDMIVGLFDSGIHMVHEMFSDPLFPMTEPGIYPHHRKVAAYKVYKTARFGDVGAAGYHGTGVAATLAGDDSVTGNRTRFDGMAPDSRIYFVDIANNNGTYVIESDMTELLDSVRLGLGMTEPVRQVSGSFGTGYPYGYYRLEEASLDAVCWQDKWFFVTWAAGNFGQGMYNIGHPACAKNCLTVGSTGNGTASNTIARSSSGGPTRDNRIKPNVVAPGDDINTAGGPEPSRYVLTGGTSFSAPAVSGDMVLVRQYFRDGWYPSGTPDSSRGIRLLSAAMMRALAVTAADSNVSTESPPARLSGWGRANLSGVLHFDDDSLQLAVVDETLGLATGELFEYRLDVERRAPLVITLAWTDTAAAPGAAVAIVNDLDLELESPDHNRYRGNRFYEGQSVPNPPTRDELNVEEVCRLTYPMAGPWTVRVYARNVFNSRQPFALVVRSGVPPLPAVAESRTTLHRAGTTLVAHWPMPLLLDEEQELTVFGADGRLAAHTRVLSAWDGRDRQGHRLAPGVYYYRLGGPASPGRTGKLIVVR